MTMTRCLLFLVSVLLLGARDQAGSLVSRSWVIRAGGPGGPIWPGALVEVQTSPDNATWGAGERFKAGPDGVASAFFWVEPSGVFLRVRGVVSMASLWTVSPHPPDDLILGAWMSQGFVRPDPEGPSPLLPEVR